MARKKQKKQKEPKLIEEDDILHAREVKRRFEDISPNVMSVGSKRKLVRIFYLKIFGTPVGKLPGDQLHRIAERLYHESYKILRSPEAATYCSIEKMAKTAGAERSRWDERACIQLEGNDIPENSSITRAYDKIKSKF